MLKKWIAGILVTMMVVQPLGVTADTNNVSNNAIAEDILIEENVGSSISNIANPRIVPDSSMTAGQKVTYDCIWFGSYPQAEVVPDKSQYTAIGSDYLENGDIIENASLYSQLQSATYNSKNETTIGGTRYRRMLKSDATYGTSFVSSRYNWSDRTTYHYFKYEPIKWRVIEKDSSSAFLLADKGLDNQEYNKTDTNVTWETCTLRDYLNSTFYDNAFNTTEKGMIIKSTVENADNLYYGTSGGNNTSDNVFLLAEKEVYKTKDGKSFTDSTAAVHGFVDSHNTNDEARRARSTVFSKAMGTWWDTDSSYKGNCFWWMRSPGNSSSRAADVYYYGFVYIYGSYVTYDYAVRPALKIHLSSLTDSMYAGTVCSDGTVNETAKPGDGGGSGTPIPTPTTAPTTGKAGINATYSLTKLSDGSYELNINGSGAMYEYDSYEKAPWYSYMEKVKTINISDNITYIGDYCFGGCNDYYADSKLKLPISAEVPYYAFDNAITLENIEFTKGTGIGYDYTKYYTKGEKYMKDNPYEWFAASYPWFNAETVIIDNGVTSIGSYMFSNKFNLWPGVGFVGVDELYMPDTVTQIGNETFSGLLLDKCKISKNITSVGEYAFAGMACDDDAFTPVALELTSVGRHSFAGSNIIKSVSLKNIKTIPEGAFGSCENLEEVSLNGVELIQKSAFYYCIKLVNVNSMNAIAEIEEGAFKSCYKLDKLVFPSTLKKVGEEALDSLNTNAIITFYSRDCDFSNASWITGTIVGYLDSTAEAYAKRLGNTFIPLDEGEVPTPNPGVTPGVTPGATTSYITIATKQKIYITDYMTEQIPFGHKIKFVSSVKGAATVNGKGIVTGKLKSGKGSTTILIYDKNTKEIFERINISVVAPQYSKKVTANIGETYKLSDYFVGEGLTPTGFSSNKPYIATVDEKGNINVVGRGSAVISYYVGVGKNAAKYKLKIKVI